MKDMARFINVANRKGFCNAALIKYVSGLNSTCEAEKKALREELREALQAKLDAEKDRDSARFYATIHSIVASLPWSLLLLSFRFR